MLEVIQRQLGGLLSWSNNSLNVWDILRVGDLIKANLVKAANFLPMCILIITIITVITRNISL